MSFKKPTTLLRQANVALHKKLGLDEPDDKRPRHTDRMTILSPGVTIAYHKRKGEDYPTAQMKNACLAGARRAQAAVAKAANVLAGVSMLRQKESDILTRTLAAHFNLVEGDLANGTLSDNTKDKSFALSDMGKHDRRWVIEKIRKQMLHLSFHLNTGMYLIDIDPTNRKTAGGAAVDPTQADPNEEAYVIGRTSLKRGCGYRNGEIHINFDELKTYSPNSYARVIIHEACHKYLEADDHEVFDATDNDNHPAYAHQGIYASLPLLQRLTNADCIAWTAISLYAGAVKMATPAAYHPDWENS